MHDEDHGQASSLFASSLPRDAPLPQMSERAAAVETPSFAAFSLQKWTAFCAHIGPPVSCLSSIFTISVCTHSF